MQNHQFIDGMSMIGIHYHCIRQMTLFMYSFNFKLSTVFFSQIFQLQFLFLPQSMVGKLNILSDRHTNRQTEKREKNVIEVPDIILLLSSNETRFNIHLKILSCLTANTTKRLVF